MVRIELMKHRNKTKSSLLFLAKTFTNLIIMNYLRIFISALEISFDHEFSSDEKNTQFQSIHSITR